MSTDTPPITIEKITFNISVFLGNEVVLNEIQLAAKA